MLFRSGLDEERYRKADEYSMGMQQRLKLATALVHDPDLLLLDEPTNGLDPRGREEMLTLIRDLAHTHGKHIVFSSHLLPDVERVCTNVVMLRDEIGRLYTSVKTLELLNARMITKLGRGEMPAAEASVMKLAMARIVSQGGEVGLRLLGPDAVQKNGAWQDVFLMAPSFHIAGGTDEIQKNQAAERVLGLPREAQPDRDLPFDQIARS